MQSLSKGILAICLIAFSTKYAQAQSTLSGQTNSVRVPIPAVPFLSIAPDARAAAMGDAGVATSPDANATFWNPAKLAFVDNPNSISLAYTPWLRNLVGDMSLSYLSGYHRLDKNSTLAVTLNYFDLGLIEFTNNQGVTTGTYNSKEFSMGTSYARKLSKNIGVGVSLRYINSNLTGSNVINNVATKPGTSVSGDISIYKSPNLASGKTLNWAWGAVISNLGGKINYGGSGGKYYIPTNFRLGTAAHYKPNAFNRVTFAVDMNKLMIPTPPERDPANNQKILRGRDVNDGAALGRIFGSFADAPDGFKEELKEMTFSIGAEYAYKEQFMFRGGYFYENKAKGGRNYLTAGFGAKFSNKYSFDFAYLFQPTQGSQSSPLNNTLRFTLGIFFDKNTKNENDEPSLN